MNKTEWAANYKNGSQIQFVEADIAKDPNLNKLRGLEITCALLEEANEMEESAFSVLLTRVGRWKNFEYGIPPLILATCNPDKNWVKQKFYDPWSRGELKEPYYFEQALPYDNPYNTPEYLASLEDLPEAEYARYVKGDWNYASDPNQMVLFEWLTLCFKDTIEEYRRPKYIGIDVAREGNDKTVFCYMDDRGIIKFEEFDQLKSFETGELVSLRIKEFGLKGHNIGVDGIGLGAGVIDDCERRGIYVTTFKSSESPTSNMQHFVFTNMRAQAHWMMREDIREQTIECKHDYEFQKQALQIKYFVEEKQIKIESKKELKKRLGCSPDKWESAVIANFMRHQSGLPSDKRSGGILFVKFKDCFSRSKHVRY
jgi:hypothetical protein